MDYIIIMTLRTFAIVLFIHNTYYILYNNNIYDETRVPSPVLKICTVREINNDEYNILIVPYYNLI